MKHSIISLTLLLCALGLKAQEKDSINSINSVKFRADSAAWNIYQFSKKSPFWLISLMPDQYSEVTSNYSFSKGHFIPAQGSSKTNAIQMATEGSTSIKGIKLWGSFNFDKVTEDSTRWAHQTRNNPSTPIYYGSPAYNHYERSVYNFKAFAAKNIANNKIPLAFGIDYRIGDHFSDNDPRGAISDYQFNLIGTIGYQFNTTTIGAGYRYGYGQESVKIGYMNSAYYETNNYPNYTSYMISGYKETKYRQGTPFLDNDMKRSGPEIYINHQSTLGHLSASISWIKETQNFSDKNFLEYPADFIKENTNSKGQLHFSDYKLDKKELNIWYTKAIRHHQLSIGINSLITNGLDYLPLYKANSYVYEQNKHQLKAIFTQQGRKTQYIWQFNTGLLSESRKDGSAGNHIAFDRYTIGGAWAINKQLQQQHFLGFGIAANYQNSFGNQFTVPESNEERFTRTVIFHDYLYNTSSSITAMVNGSYKLPLYKQIQTEFKLGVSYISKLSTLDLNRVIQSSPGKDLFQTNLSIGFYF